ncbi:MAG: ribonucleotide reductase N-terminal alpha domain-containing protein [Caldilineaceae bacterium]
MSTQILGGAAPEGPVERRTTATKLPHTVIENVKGERQSLTVPDYVDDERIDLPPNAIKVLEKRYLRRDLDGSLLETPAGMFYRIAYHIAQVEKQYDGDADAMARVFYNLLTEQRFYPNSPTFTGAGTPLGQLAACFTADMRVTCEQGVKRIADLEVGDRVLTHEGRYRPVTELFQRAYDGELLRIKIKLIGTTMEVTPEHPILTPRGWVKAGELNIGDLVAIGTARGVRTAPRFDLAESVYAEEMELQATESAVRVRRPSTYQNSGRQAEWNTRFVEVTPALARLCGYYVAEGTIGPDERYVRFTFNRDELEFHKDVTDLVETVFNAPVNQSHSTYGNWMNINVYSRTVTTWFRTHLGRGSDKKRLPVWLQYAEPEIQEAFLIGLLRGDGLYTENLLMIKGRKTPKLFRSLRLTLSNPGLIQQVWQMCLRLGYDAAVRPVDTTYVTPTAKDTAQVSMPPLQSRELVKKAFGQDLPEPDMRYVRNIVQRDAEQVFFPIERIESVNFSGTVYNCEVDEDHSYVTEGVVVHNCFVLPIEDDMGKTSDGIFSTLRVAALIQQTGGGNGFSFSRLRPKNDVVHTSSGRATGPVGFLRVYDQAFGEIAQGGSRRGANMAVLRVDHPDIESFVECKEKEGAVSNFNISVAITDKFMHQVQEDGDFELRNPRDGKVWKTVRARDLFDKIVKYAHHNGEPGALFIDAANRSNPVPHLYELEATNP